MLRPLPNHGTLRLPNDDDDDGRSVCVYLWVGLRVCADVYVRTCMRTYMRAYGVCVPTYVSARVRGCAFAYI